MSYLYKNKFSGTYAADVGKIVKVMDPNSMFDTKLMYVASGTNNGYCYKDYDTFQNHPDEVCYIAECCFNETLFVDYVNDNKEKLIKEGGLSTTNSIKEEIRNDLEFDKYYYEYEKDGETQRINAKDFDEDLISKIAEDVIDTVDWQTTQAYICETDWREEVAYYYDEKFKNEQLEM